MLRFQSTIEELKDGVEEKLQSAINELLLESISHSCVEFERFIALIESTFDIAHCESTGQYRIKPEIDSSLKEMAEKILILDKKAHSLLNKVLIYVYLKKI